MGGVRQPFIYEAVKNDDGRFQSTTFDPKAITRASWEEKPQKPKPTGPLVSINRHPDAHVVPNQRQPFKTMGRRTKNWIMYMRSVQLVCRVLELIGAVGLLIVMILLNKIEALPAWVLRITLGVAIVHCIYAIFHLSRPAGGRTPGSSAAYHVFASVSDLAIIPLYSYGVLTARNHGDKWGTLLQDKELASAYFVPSVKYGLLGAEGLHLLSLAISLWLGVMFRRIVMMPPDMNPLESHLTSRAHKRSKSSMTTSSYADSEKRLDSSLGDHRLSGMSQADFSRPPSVPFMHTRHGSQVSLSTQDSRLNLPSRQYQIAPSNSPRNSATSQDLKRMSAPPRSSNRNSYTDISLRESGATTSRPNSSYSRPGSSRPSSGNVAHRPEHVPAAQTAQPRSARFTEAWYASESLINRTQERTRAMNQMNAANKRRAYEALNPAYDPDSEDSDNNDENKTPSSKKQLAPEKDSPGDDSLPHHPNPLRSHPTATAGGTPPRRPYTPYRASALSEVNLNDRRVSGSNNIADVGRNHRDSSIQPELFFSKPYGQLKPGTPPIMVGGNLNRQVSSGNDYDLGGGGVNAGFGRRNVSGKIAEEGRAGEGRERWSRYSVLNE